MVLVSAGIIGFSIFIPPLIGLADSGDFGRILPWRGLAHVSTEYDTMYFRYFNSKYRIIPKWEGPDWYKTSTSLLVAPARWLSIRFGRDRLFDIRTLAALYTVIFLFGLWLLLVGSRSLGVSLRVILAVLVVLIFTDAGYTAYFNSFYSEATALAFLAVAVGASAVLIARGPWSHGLLIIYFAAAAMVVTAKPMYAPLAPALALFGVYLARRSRRRGRQLLWGGLAISLCLVAAWYVSRTPSSTGADSAYIGIFMDLLPNSPTPRQDLVDLGLRPAYSAFSGTTPYQPDSPLKRNSQFRSEFNEHVRSHTLILFYLTHPDHFRRLCVRCVRHAFTTRVRRLGYYEASTGRRPLAQPFGLWSVVREGAAPKTVFFLGLFFATGIPAAVGLIRSTSPIRRGILLLYLLFIFIAGLQFVIAVTVGGGEPDVEKHLFMFNLAFDACFILLALGAVYLRAQRVASDSVSRRATAEHVTPGTHSPLPVTADEPAAPIRGASLSR